MTGSPLEVRPGTQADDEARDDLVRRVPGGCFFQLSGWRRVVEQAFGHAGRDLIAVRSGEVVGVLPLMECRGVRGRPSLISMPYAVYGGPVGVDAEVQTMLMAGGEALARESRVGRLELRLRSDPKNSWARSSLYATFERELPNSPEGVLASMPKKARAEARKARERHDLVLDEGPWYLPDLAALFHRNKHSLGSPGLPDRFFQGLLETYPGDVHIHLVRKDRTPLAAVMSFRFGDTLCAYYSGTAAGADRDFSASNFMYLALQEWCVERGITRFDFGRSRKDSGAFDFKRRQGFQAVDLHYRYLLVRDTSKPSLNPSNPKTRVLQELWRRLPSSAARALSGGAARYLP